MLLKTTYGLLRLLAGAVAFVVLYGLMAFLLGRWSVPAEPVAEEPVQLYLLSNGVHTDIVLPVRHGTSDLRTWFPPSDTRSGDSSAQWVAIGWGDRGFYLETPTWADLSPRVAIHAVAGLGDCALHVTYHHRMQEGELCKPFTIDAQAYGKLKTYIANALVFDGDGRTEPIPTEARYGAHDAFYAGKGAYSLFHTCNTWTNNALRTAGARACLWTPFQGPILRQYR